MLPFYHPTTVLVADDEPLFLKSFKYSYGDQFLCHLERSPEAAIARLLLSNAEWQNNCILQRSLTEKTDAWFSPDDFVVQLQPSLGPSWLQKPSRFATVSVVIVDCVMPSMSGTDLCRRIKELPVKKILLTGRAGDQTAVEAFNAGLIDHFLVKHDTDINKKLPNLIDRLQRAYFEQAAQPFHVLKNRPSRSFLAHPQVVELVETLLKQHRAVEHYITMAPSGVLFATADGRVKFIAVADEDDRQAQREIAEASNAPGELLASLNSNQTLAVFPTPSHHYEGYLQHSWARYIRPANCVDSDDFRWWIRVVDGPECGIRLPEKVAGLSEYRELIDNPAP